VSLPSQPEGWSGPGNRQLFFGNKAAVEVANHEAAARRGSGAGAPAPGALLLSRVESLCKSPREDQCSQPPA